MSKYKIFNDTQIKWKTASIPFNSFTYFHGKLHGESTATVARDEIRKYLGGWGGNVILIGLHLNGNTVEASNKTILKKRFSWAFKADKGADQKGHYRKQFLLMSWWPFSCPLGAAAGFVLCTCPTGESNKNFYQELMISSFFPRQVKHQLAPLALVANCQSWWNCRAQHEDRVGLCTGTLPRPAQQRAAQTAQPSHHKSLGRQILW